MDKPCCRYTAIGKHDCDLSAEPFLRLRVQTISVQGQFCWEQMHSSHHADTLCREVEKPSIVVTCPGAQFWCAFLTKPARAHIVCQPAQSSIACYTGKLESGAASAPAQAPNATTQSQMGLQEYQLRQLAALLGSANMAALQNITAAPSEPQGLPDTRCLLTSLHCYCCLCARVVLPFA